MCENQNIEWKQVWKDEYLKWICGFANAHGGIIYIGKDDFGNVVGIANGKDLLEKIPNKVRDTMGIIVDVNLHKENDKEFIEVITSSNHYPVSYNGEYHYRTGSTKQQLRGQMLDQFLLRKLKMTWDAILMQGIHIDDFRNDSFDIFKEKAVHSKRIDESDLSLSNFQLLDSLNLIENNEFKKAAILLFHHKPEKWIAGAYVKIGYFETDADLIYQDEIHGSLISQADRVVDLIYTKYLKAIISYDGVIRVETYPFPKEAVREAVYNAIVHKDYATLVPIQISVYADRLYIANDCVFPDGWTVEDLLNKHKSRPHNPLIANTFFRAGFIESWGRGIEKITNSCLASGNPEPLYTVRGGDIMIMFKSNTYQEVQNKQNLESSELSEDFNEQSLVGNQRNVYLIVKNNPNITLAEIVRKSEIEKESVRNAIKQLVKKQLIKYKGDNTLVGGYTII